MVDKVKKLCLRIGKNILVRKSNRLTKYYKDEYSLDLLKARQDYMKTGNISAMMKMMINYDNNLCFELFDVIPKINKGGRVYIVYNGFDSVVEYTELLFKHTIYKENIAMCDISTKKLDDINACDLIIPIMKDWDLREFLNNISENNRNLFNNLYIPKRRVMNGECGRQYLDLFTANENEIIVNAGCLDCKTDLEMLKWGEGKVKKIYALEPDPVNAEVCRKIIKENRVEEIVTLVEKGAWSENLIMKFNSNPKDVGSGMISESGISVEVDKIDNIVGEDAVTFIKMDIEGAELPALKGAKETIIKNRPKLAICIYHKESDIYIIPKYILSIVPEYRFYIRHYNSNSWETVLYAVCE